MVFIFVTYGMLNDNKGNTTETVVNNDDGGGFDEF